MHNKNSSHLTHKDLTAKENRKEMEKSRYTDNNKRIRMLMLSKGILQEATLK